MERESLPDHNFLIYRLLIILIVNKVELQQLLYNFSDFSYNVQIGPNEQIILTKDPSMKTLYNGQFYIQFDNIKKKDVQVAFRSFDSFDFVKVVVSKSTISNLSFYSTIDLTTYLYLYEFQFDSEDDFKSFMNTNKVNIKKYEKIHLLKLESNLVKSFCDEEFKKKKIFFYVYTQDDLKILTQFFKENPTISVPTNIKIMLCIGWIDSGTTCIKESSYECNTLLPLYVDLILSMIKYRQKNKKLKINDTYMNMESFENNKYFMCAQEILERYITKNNTINDNNDCLKSLIEYQKSISTTTVSTNNDNEANNNEETTVYVSTNNNRQPTVETTVDVSTINNRQPSVEPTVETDNQETTVYVSTTNNRQPTVETTVDVSTINNQENTHTGSNYKSFFYIFLLVVSCYILYLLIKSKKKKS